MPTGGNAPAIRRNVSRPSGAGILRDVPARAQPTVASTKPRHPPVFAYQRSGGSALCAAPSLASAASRPPTAPLTATKTPRSAFGDPTARPPARGTLGGAPPAPGVARRPPRPVRPDAAAPAPAVVSGRTTSMRSSSNARAPHPPRQPLQPRPPTLAPCTPPRGDHRHGASPCTASFALPRLQGHYSRALAGVRVTPVLVLVALTLAAPVPRRRRPGPPPQCARHCGCSASSCTWRSRSSSRPPVHEQLSAVADRQPAFQGRLDPAGQLPLRHARRHGPGVHAQRHRGTLFVPLPDQLVQDAREPQPVQILRTAVPRPLACFVFPPSRQTSFPRRVCRACPTGSRPAQVVATVLHKPATGGARNPSRLDFDR